MRWRSAVFGLLLTLAAGGGARAEAPAEALQTHLYAGSIAEGERVLARLSRANKEGQAALGMLRFVAAFERFGQGLHRYGLQAPRTAFMPLLAFPVPRNPNPEKITYEAFRALLAQFVADLDRAQTTLEAVGDAPVKLPLDVLKLRIDINSDGKAEESERFVSLFMTAFGGARAGVQSADPGAFVIGFDTADMYWLRGYSNLLAVAAEFFLAHDFRDSFDNTFHRFFPQADLPFARISGEGRQRDRREAGDFSTLGDAVAFIHLLRWKTIEPERLVRMHARLKTVAELNRRTWAAANSETDNDREWLPNPRQQGVLPGVPVTAETVASWLDFVETFEKVLDGKLLVPHWRFEKGVNLKRLLTESKEFDAVLWFTGHAALPFLEEGPVADRMTWTRATRGLGGNFLMYAFYFN